MPESTTPAELLGESSVGSGRQLRGNRGDTASRYIGTVGADIITVLYFTSLFALSQP
jgi:hypothetical protein